MLNQTYPLVDLLFILITFLLDNVIILQEEISYWSLLRVKGTLVATAMDVEKKRIDLLKSKVSNQNTLSHSHLFQTYTACGSLNLPSC